MRHEVHGRRHLRLRGRPSAPNACNLQTFKSMRSHGHSAAFGRLARPQATHTHTHTERAGSADAFLQRGVRTSVLAQAVCDLSTLARGLLQSINLSRPRTVAEFSDLSVGGGSSSKPSSNKKAWRRERHEPEKPAQHRRARARCAPGPNLGQVEGRLVSRPPVSTSLSAPQPDPFAKTWQPRPQRAYSRAPLALLQRADGGNLCARDRFQGPFRWP